MSKEAMKLALEALELVNLEFVCGNGSHHAKKDRHEWDEDCPITDRWKKAITTLREALAEQPAQRTWVGLTDEDIDIAFDDTQEGGGFDEFARAIEAKLKEKNGWYRQHVTDGSPCWCEPEISYTNPETGASVIVHKEPQ